MYVVDRLVDSVCAIDYPRDRLEIQVLDDSTDETTRHRRGGGAPPCRRGRRHQVHPPHRPRRATRPARSRPGMQVARGDFIAIFDADFIPRRDFLRKTVHYFTDDKVAMVQTRWGHLNRGLLAAHARSRRSSSTGTSSSSTAAATAAAASSTSTAPPASGGATAIVDGGGWQHDTLTEDLDLSYRTQLKGWQFVFLPDHVAPGRAAGGDERLQEPAAPLGQGLDPDLPEADAAHPALGPAAQGEGRGVLPPVGQLQLPADVRAVGADGAVDGHPLQHGLVRDAAHRRAAVLRGDGVGGQLLHGVPARAVPARPGPSGCATCRS